MFSSQSTPSTPTSSSGFKRQLFSSPSTPSTPRTPGSSDSKRFKSYAKSSLVGAIQMVGVKQIGKNNDFFDIKVQIGVNNFKNLRVMMMGTVPDMREYLHAPKRLTYSLKEDMNFFNPKFRCTIEDIQHKLPFTPTTVKDTPLKEITAQRNDELINIVGTFFWTGEPGKNNGGTGFRNGILTNGTDSLRITIWRMYESVEEGKVYTLSDVSIVGRKYVKGETTKETVIMEMPTAAPCSRPSLEQFLLNEDTVILDGVRIINIKTNVVKLCNNSNCNKQLTEVDENEEFVRCKEKTCLSLMNVNDLQEELSGEITVLNGEKKIVLTLSHHVILNFGYGNDLQQLEKDLLSARDLKVIYDESNRSVVKLVPNNQMETEDASKTDEIDDQTLTQLVIPHAANDTNIPKKQVKSKNNKK